MIQFQPKLIDCGDEHAEITNLLRDLASEAESDVSIKGVIVIVERDDAKLSLFTASRFQRARERAYYALHRAAAWILSKD